MAEGPPGGIPRQEQQQLSVVRASSANPTVFWPSEKRRVVLPHEITTVFDMPYAIPTRGYFVDSILFLYNSKPGRLEMANNNNRIAMVAIFSGRLYV